MITETRSVPLLLLAPCLPYYIFKDQIKKCHDIIWQLYRLENDFDIPQNGLRFNDRLVPTWPFAFTGFLYLDKIVAEFHRIPAVIQKFFKQLICRAVIVTVSQIFQDVAAQKAPLILIHIPAQQIPCTDAFQLKVLDILQQFID